MLMVDQGDHGQVVAKLMAEPKDGIKRPVDILRINPGREHAEKGVEQVARGFEYSRTLGDPLFQISMRPDEFLGHVLEGEAQGADLISRGDVDLGVQIAPGDRVGCRGQFANGPGVLTSDQVGRSQSQGKNQPSQKREQPCRRTTGA